MAEMVDSKKKTLNSAQIVVIALKNTKSEYPLEVALPAILTEMSQPNSEVKQIGNTLFSVLKGESGQGFFKALNADTAANYVANSKEFCVWAHDELGLRILVTEFVGHEIAQLFKAISRNPPLPDMGYQTFHMESGATRIALKLGD